MIKNNLMTALASQLGAAGIPGLEDIARDVQANSTQNYEYAFAKAIADHRIRALGLKARQDNFFTYIMEVGQMRVAVKVCPREIFSDLHKDQIKRFARIDARSLEAASACGIIYFAPFSFNNGTARSNIASVLPVSFVNLPYDRNGLERRARSYVQK